MSILEKKTTQADGAAALTEALGVTYRMPRVNLLPPEIFEARRFKRTQGALAVCVAATLLVAGGVYVLSQQRADNAQDDLTTAQARTTVLQAEQAEYAEVPRVLAQVESAQLARETAMSTDVLWYRYLNDLALSYPAEVWLGNLTATVAGPGAATGAAAVPVAGSNPLATPGVGTVTFTGTALDHPDVASWLDVLAGTPGFADPYFSSSQKSQIDGTDVVEFTSQVVVTPDALSGRYDRKAQ